MSFVALGWASKQVTGGLATKSALLAFANYADEDGCAYPSTAAIAEFGEMDHKTATAAIHRLVALGLIVDTGERAGRTKQVRVYRLALGSPPKTEASQKRKPSAFSSKAPQKRCTDTVMEPEGIEANASTPIAWARPAYVDRQVWKDLMANRKAKRALNTPTSWKRFRDDLHRVSAETGWPPGKLIEHAAASGWAGIYDPTARNFSHGQSRHSGLGKTSAAIASLGDWNDDRPM